MSWAPRIRTWNRRHQGPPLRQLSYRPLRAFTGCHPRLAGRTRSGRSLELEAECARPDLNRDAPRGAQRPQRCASAIPPRAHESRHPGSNRAVRCTKAEPQAVRGGKAGIPGFEPGELPGQSRAGLPIPPYPIECGRCDSNAQAARFGLARSFRLPSIPRTPPGIRTPNLRIKSPWL